MYLPTAIPRTRDITENPISHGQQELLYEGILGVKRDYEGLRISPCFPEEWEEAEVTRYFRGADYHIIIRNPEHIKNGKAEVYADGSICDSGLIPDYQDAKQHRIDVLIKRG